MVIPEANRAFVADRLKCDSAWPIGCDDYITVSFGFGDVNIGGLAAAHEELEFDELGRSKNLGYIVSFGDFTIYHAGDNKGFDGMAEELLARVGDRKIDVALLPINGRKPERRVPGNFWGHEAAKFAHDINARMAIPMHYEMFTFNTETPDEFVATCQQLNQPQRVLRCGERWSSNQLS